MQHQDEQKITLLPPKEPQPQHNQTHLNTPTTNPPAEVIHKVQYGDTLQGLSLEYSVPIGKIRYRNHIEGDSLYHLKQIIIPNPQIIPESKQATQTLLMEQFVGHMDYSQKSLQVARYYLGQSSWNMQGALKQYKQDLLWQRQNKQKLTSQPIAGSMIEMKEIKRFYNKMELLQKKKQ